MAAKLLENDKVNIRMPDGLRNRIKASAAQHGRSLNNEIVVALLERYPDQTENAKLTLDLLEYIMSAETDLEFLTRASMVESNLRKMNSRAHLIISEDEKTISIAMDDDPTRAATRRAESKRP